MFILPLKKTYFETYMTWVLSEIKIEIYERGGERKIVIEIGCRVSTEGYLSILEI